MEKIYDLSHPSKATKAPKLLNLEINTFLNNIKHYRIKLCENKMHYDNQFWFKLCFEEINIFEDRAITNDDVYIFLSSTFKPYLNK
jgi:hypothetical protein